VKLLSKRRRTKTKQRFSGRVEVVVSGLDEEGRSIAASYTNPWRRSLRVGETTVDEVYAIVAKALEEHCEGESLG